MLRVPGFNRTALVRTAHRQHARQESRAGRERSRREHHDEWPPESAGVDALVHATPLLHPAAV